MAWADAVLSTSASIAKIETEINSLTATDWTDKIAMSKELIGDKLEVVLTERSYSVDEDSGEVLLDLIANPTVFNLVSDYLTLHLIYDDLSNANVESIYGMKAEKYKKLYDLKFEEDLRRMNLDIDMDDDTDIYRVDWIGKLSR